MVQDPWLPELFTRAEARAAGMTDRQITRRLSNGSWIAERRGFLRLAQDKDKDIGDVVAAWRAYGGGRFVVSHTSAARYWHLPTPLRPSSEITLTTTSGGTHQRHGVRVRVATLPPDEVRRPGILVTSPARTVVDCARVLPPRDALAIADAALHRGLVGADELVEAVARQCGRRGIGDARAVVGLADGRRESALESWSAWGLAEVGIPLPRWQVSVLTPGGRLIGRVDAWWPEGVAGEADGRAKYALRAGDAVSPKELQRVFDAEKRREGALRDLGVDVVPWNAEDVLRPDLLTALANRIRDRLNRARDHPRFSGRTRD